MLFKDVHNDSRRRRRHSSKIWDSNTTFGIVDDSNIESNISNKKDCFYCCSSHCTITTTSNNKTTTTYSLVDNCANNYFIDVVETMKLPKQTTASITTTMTNRSTRRKKRSLFQQKAGEFCQTSTLHGVGDWYRADNSHIKLFWTVCFLGALSAAVYGCYAILEQYLKAPVVVSYFVKQPNGSLMIPDVIICPFNRFDKNFFAAHDIETDLAQYIEFAFGQGAKHPVQAMANTMIMKNLTRTGSLLPYAVKLNDTLQRLNMTFNEFLDASSIPCKDFIVSCGRPSDCCEGGSVMSGSGKCYRINGIDQVGSGYPFAMNLVITLPKHRYTFSPNNFIGDGIAVKLAERGKGVDFDLTFIPVGTHAVMPLKGTRYEFINDPPRYECLDDRTETYSHMACLDGCPWEKAQNVCGCSHPAASFETNLPSCTTYQLYSCLLSPDNFHATLMDDCRRKCLPKCNYWQYAAQLSYTNFPADNVKNSSAASIDDETWEQMKNSIILDVYYERFESTVIKHYPAMTVDSFIANIGGQYSLWLGGSILTLIQLLVFVTQYLFHLCYRQWLKSRDRRKQKKVGNPVVRLARESSGSIGWDRGDKGASSKGNNEANPVLMDHHVTNYSSPPIQNNHCQEFLF